MSPTRTGALARASRLRLAVGITCSSLGVILAALLIINLTSVATPSVLYVCKNATGDLCKLQAAGPLSILWVRASVLLVSSVLLITAGAVTLLRWARLRADR